MKKLNDEQRLIIDDIIYIYIYNRSKLLHIF
jgi:hypothetical protein